MLLTSLNLSHFPVSHLSSRKLPLSERAETCPKATAHTHSKATLSICGHTTAHTDRERTLGPAVGHRNRAETEAVQSASHLRRTLSVSSVNINTELSGGFFLPCRISCSPDCMCSLPFLPLLPHRLSAPAVCAQQKTGTRSDACTSSVSFSVFLYPRVADAPDCWMWCCYQLKRFPVITAYENCSAGLQYLQFCARIYCNSHSNNKLLSVSMMYIFLYTFSIKYTKGGKNKHI